MSQDGQVLRGSFVINSNQDIQWEEALIKEEQEKIKSTLFTLISITTKYLFYI